MKPALKLFLGGMLISLALPLGAQQLDRVDHERVRQMLKDITNDIRKDYYDPKLHGFDLDGRVRDATEQLDKAENLGQAFRIIAWTLEGLNDSHTYFVPPLRANQIDYGWQMQAIGDRCYVVRVRPGTDADAKGLKPGDEILSVNAIPATRTNSVTISYLYNLLAPQQALHLQLRGADGQSRDLVVAAKVRQFLRVPSDLRASSYQVEMNYSERILRPRCEKLGDELAACKLPEFDLNEDDVHSFLNTARKQKNLILDLRGNPGGSVNTLSWLVGGFFDHEVKIGDRVGRKTLKPQMAKPTHVLDGKLVVLVDSKSSSAAELFARVMQLEKRATVIGDRSSGLVMEGRYHGYAAGASTGILYGALITDADIIMTDGKSLEGNGVIPDELMLPTAEDLRNGRDPVLAHAAELLGAKISPDKAGKLFPFEWPKD